MGARELAPIKFTTRVKASMYWAGAYKFESTYFSELFQPESDLWLSF